MTFPARTRLNGLKVVIDCANGAAYKAAPEVLWELGAEVIPIGVTPNGFNINDKCGSTYTRTAAEAVVAHGADVGIALDGDADRVMIIDENGRVADGDQMMALLAGRWAEKGTLTGGALVATVMSNLGLERFLAGRGLGLERTPVGDRYVVERMRAGGFNLGGEQSGHIVMTDLRHHRRRADRRASVPGGDGRHRQARLGAEPQLRAGAADAEERPLCRRRRAAVQTASVRGDRRRRGAAERRRAGC